MTAKVQFLLMPSFAKSMCLMMKKAKAMSMASHMLIQLCQETALHVALKVPRASPTTIRQAIASTLTLKQAQEPLSLHLARRFVNRLASSLNIPSLLRLPTVTLVV